MIGALCHPYSVGLTSFLLQFWSLVHHVQMFIGHGDLYDTAASKLFLGQTPVSRSKQLHFSGVYVISALCNEMKERTMV